MTTADFLLLSKNFGKTNATYAQGDVNGDGTVNLADLLLLTRNMGRSLAVPVSPHAVEVDASGYRGQTVWVTFSSDVSGSLTPAALSITNVATGKQYSPVSVSYDAGTNTATFVFGGVLPEGNYPARLLASQVANAAGYHLDGNGDGVAGDDYTLGFYNLAGDLNGDGKVDAADFAILSRGFGKTGASYAQGDLNGDGTVNLTCCC